MPMKQREYVPTVFDWSVASDEKLDRELRIMQAQFASPLSGSFEYRYEGYLVDRFMSAKQERRVRDSRRGL